jgi:hypothetical protein
VKPDERIGPTASWNEAIEAIDIGALNQQPVLGKLRHDVRDPVAELIAVLRRPKAAARRSRASG